MDLPLSLDVAARLIVLEEAGSTNDELATRAAAENLDEFTVVATLRQTSGRGRLGRAWQAPAGTALAASVLLRPRAALGREYYGWIPLVAGLAMCRSIARVVPNREVALKWPNDVLIDGNKACGILSEALADGSVVVGSGVNLTIPADALPVPTATSLLVAGAIAPAEELADLVLSGYLTELERLWGDAPAGEAADWSGGIHAAVSEVCATLGQRVRVTFPDGTELLGTAESIDDTGRLNVLPKPGGRIEAVAAGDVTHLRYE